jgi:hypothetical protein
MGRDSHGIAAAVPSAVVILLTDYPTAVKSNGVYQVAAIVLNVPVNARLAFRRAIAQVKYVGLVVALTIVVCGGETSSIRPAAKSGVILRVLANPIAALCRSAGGGSAVL